MALKKPKKPGQQPFALQMRGIEKSFHRNAVLRGVDLAVRRGEIRALLGENGAGKSTLMNILGGIVPMDAGEILLDGKPVRIASARDAIDNGIAFIHQELNLVSDLRVYENIFLGCELRRGLRLNHWGMRVQTNQILRHMKLPLSADALVGNLDASYRQVVEIARALRQHARILIMDEPTTSLTDVEIHSVFKLLRTLRDRGMAVLFISHKLGEVRALCDTYTVLRDGAVVASGDVKDVDERDLARFMVGRDVSAADDYAPRPLGEEALRVEAFSSPRRFIDISFSMRAGEIVGFTGLLGDGRSELFSAIFGCDPHVTGSMFVGGRRVRVRSTEQALRLGIGYVPRNRKENGIVKDMSILHNASLVTLRSLRRRHRPGLDLRLERERFARRAQEMRIRMGSMDDAITSLSGGNQQKVVLAKWLDANPRVMIFDNPTQGVDVGAKEEIYALIRGLAASGVAVAVLSSEAQEIIRLCDRTFVLYHGLIQDELPRERMTEENIMLLATGGGLAGAQDVVGGND